jgi:5-methylcytosine-specific restriction endonuclease McrA
VKLRVFEAHEGRCHISGAKIMPGMQWHCDHVIPLIEGGGNRESNLAPALVQCHKRKTASEVARKAKANRLRQKHLGIEKKKKSQWPCGKDSPLKKKLNGDVVLR